MGVVVAHGTVDFAQKLLLLQLGGLALQTGEHVGDFFAQGGGGGGLAVGAAHHGLGGQAVCHLAQLGGDFSQLGQQHAIAGFVQHQGVGKVVDVFAGAGKVDEFVCLLDFR